MITDLDLVPGGGPISGVYTTRCCDCGWETVHIIPEESEQRMTAILNHLRDRHSLDFPAFECTVH